MNIPGILKNMANSFGSNSMRELLEDMTHQRDAHASAKGQAGAAFNLSAYTVEELFETPKARKEDGLNTVYTKRAGKEAPSGPQRDVIAAEDKEQAGIAKQRAVEDADIVQDNAQARPEPGKEPLTQVHTKSRDKEFPYRTLVSVEKTRAGGSTGSDEEPGLSSAVKPEVRSNEVEPVDISV